MLSTPHFEQSRDGLCLPACARMILAYWRHFVSEAKSAQLLGTTRSGTPISKIVRLRRWNYRVDFGSITQNELQSSIDQGTPIIAQVWPVMLTYWASNAHGSHVVVVTGYDERFVYLNDPALSQADQPLLWDAFLAAWVEFDETTAIVTLA